MKKLTLLLPFALFTSNLFAQKHNLGFSASSISGAGLTYKYAANENYQTKFNSFAFAQKDDYQTEIDLNLGLELQRNFFRTQKTRFYGLAGVSYWYSKDNYKDNYDDKNETYDNDYLNERLHFGAGFGMEIITFDNITFNLDLGYHLINSINRDEFSFGLGGGIGIGYAFGE